MRRTEFFSNGTKLLCPSGAANRLFEVERIITRHNDVTTKPRVISITQATESGTVSRR
jgi:threonine aldolase